MPRLWYLLVYSIMGQRHVVIDRVPDKRARIHSCRQVLDGPGYAFIKGDIEDWFTGMVNDNLGDTNECNAM